MPPSGWFSSITCVHSARAPRYVVPLVEGKPGPLGQGKVDARVLINADLVGPTQASLTHLTLHRTARLALHQHPGAREILYVVSGLARLRDRAGKQVNANAGDVIALGEGEPHSLESAPLSSLTMLQFFVPAGPEHAYLDSTDRSGTLPAVKEKARPGDRAMVIPQSSAKSYSILGGRGQVTLFLDGPAGKVARASLQRIEAAAGAVIPIHTHDGSDETLYILSGEGDFTVGDLVIPVGAGNALHIPMGTKHGLRVTERLVAVQCYAPGGPEQRFKNPEKK